MALSSEEIQQKIAAKFPDSTSEFMQIHDILTLTVDAGSIVEIIRFLKEDPTLRFNFLTDICGVHFPDNSDDKKFSVVYHMHNWLDNVRIRVKVFLTDTPVIDSMTSLFMSANWMERETYDFYGIDFKGHPQLKRILNMDSMVSFPMRKEFPMEDGGRTDKDDRFFGRTTDNI
ncbi:MAG: NADH-quinone oxidoreductase subunit C [Bacteroidota bacterium]